MSESLNALLATGTLLLHVAYIAFVIFGLVLTLVGLWRGWHWVRHFGFRLLHLLAIVLVVLQSWFGIVCPLTTLENHFRIEAGQTFYTQGFIADWLHRLIFFSAPPWVFITAYTIFGTLVLGTWIFGRPHRKPS